MAQASQQVTVEGHVYAKRDEWNDNETTFSLLGWKSDGDHFGIYVGPVTVTYELPAGWNPVAAELAALEAEKRAALDAYQASVTRINERIARLTAITNQVEA
jgi:hypothetical protein